MFPHISPEAWVLIGIAGWAVLIVGVLAWMRMARDDGETFDRTMHNYHRDRNERGEGQ